MLEISLLFHANLFYTDYQFSNISETIEKNYLPFLKNLLSVRNIKAVFNFSGITLELIAGEHPEFFKGNQKMIDLLKEGLGTGRIEICGSSWANVILPTLPLALQKKDIAFYLDACKRILNYTPQGFFPPELAISPLLPDLLTEAGYKWCIIDRELYDYSIKGFLNDVNDFNPRPASSTKIATAALNAGFLKRLMALNYIKKMTNRIRDYLPIQWAGVNDSKITAFVLESSWLAYSLFTFSASGYFLQRRMLKKIVKASKKYKGFLFPYSFDIEFFGTGGNSLSRVLSIEYLILFLKGLSDYDLELSLPSDYLKRHHLLGQAHYCKAGSWSSSKDFKLWTEDPDNRILENLTAYAWQVYQQKEKDFVEDQREQLLKELLLAYYKAEARGWSPVAQQRLFCYNKALKVINSCK